MSGNSGISKNSANNPNKKKAIDELKYVVKKFIFPILALDDKKISTCKRTSLDSKIEKYILLIDNMLIIFPTQNSPKVILRIALTNSYDIDELPDRIKVANCIMSELMSVIQYDYSKSDFPTRATVKNEDAYTQRMYEVAMEIGICNWLGGRSIYDLIHQLEVWAMKTYEGKKVPYSFIINTVNTNKDKQVKKSVKKEKPDRNKANFIEFLQYNNAAVFTDGISSIIKLDYEGNVVGYDSFASATEPTGYAPYRFEAFCSKCKNSEIGIALQSNGDLLIFKLQKLLLAKISGEWKFINLINVISKIKDFVGDELFANRILESLLDVSFSHSGGCLAIIADDKAQKLYIKDDLEVDTKVDDATNKKKQMVKKLLQNSDGEKFSNIDRKLRQELLALDGATIINKDGKFLAAGAIVSVPGGSDEGGRAAAAKELSRYGLAIKISMDGAITGYRDGNEIFKLL